MSFMLTDAAIAEFADKAEKAIGCHWDRNHISDKSIIENAIRMALMAQAQQLIQIVPASALSANAMLNLSK